MNQKHLLTATLILALVCSLFCGSVLAAEPTGYTSAGQVVYETYTQNGIEIIANWGARGEVATFLSPNAAAFYEGDCTYESLSSLDGGTGQGDAYQSQLYLALQKLMKDNHTHLTEYQETRYQYCYTDCERGEITKISSFYSAKALSGTWDAGATWNREHCWPKSKCINTDKKNDSADITMLRPTWVQENSDRGNSAYGISGGYFEPDDSVKGDCARIALYGYTRWGNTGKMWGSSGMIESIEVLLLWMEEDPVDTWEMGRNDAVESITGTRNVFVDYPEYAWLLFGAALPEGMTTPSGKTAAKPETTELPTEPQIETAESETQTAAPITDIPTTEHPAEVTTEVLSTEQATEQVTAEKPASASGCQAALSAPALILSISLAGFILTRRKDT